MLPILTPLIPIPFNELNPQNTLTVCLSGCKYTPHFHSHNPFLNLFFTQIFNRLITNYLAVKKNFISYSLVRFSLKNKLTHPSFATPLSAPNRTCKQHKYLYIYIL